MTILQFLEKWGFGRFGPPHLRDMMKDLHAGGMKLGEVKDLAGIEVPAAVMEEMKLMRGETRKVVLPLKVKAGGKDK